MGGGKKKKRKRRESLGELSKGMFPSKALVFLSGACTKSPQLLSLFFCALQGSTAVEECRKQTPASSTPANTCSPQALSLQRGTASPSPALGISLRLLVPGELVRGRASGCWCCRTSARGCVHPFSLPLSTGKQALPPQPGSTTDSEYPTPGINWHILSNSLLQLFLFPSAMPW